MTSMNKLYGCIVMLFVRCDNLTIEIIKVIPTESELCLYTFFVW